MGLQHLSPGGGKSREEGVRSSLTSPVPPCHLLVHPVPEVLVAPTLYPAMDFQGQFPDQGSPACGPPGWDLQEVAELVAPFQLKRWKHLPLRLNNGWELNYRSGLSSLQSAPRGPSAHSSAGPITRLFGHPKGI